VTSLPEVAGEAALYFDPRKPAEIMAVIERFLKDPSLAPQLIEHGRKQLARYDSKKMVDQYRQLFEQAAAGGSSGQDMLHGRFADGWLGRDASLTYRASSKPRELEITLFAPPWLPHEAVTLSCPQNGFRQTLARGETAALNLKLDKKGGRLRLQFEPVFQPARHEGTADIRFLSCLCKDWQIRPL
jgi:hypothetical protein